MNRLKKNIALVCLLSLIAGATAPPTFAFRASIGAVAGQKKLIEGMGKGKDDLAFSPILLEMAKLIGRTGLPPGFFLQNDSFPDEAGVDLRTLLLYQAGLIKMPIRLITGRREPARTQSAPTLILPSIPEPRKAMSSESLDTGFPSLASTPLPRDPDGTQVVSPRTTIGSPDKIRIADAASGARPAPTPLLSIDVSKLQQDLKIFGDDRNSSTELKQDLPQLAMAMPRTNAMPFITKNAFRLWTYRGETNDKSQAHGRDLDVPRPEFNGTFVVATTGAIKSITGRHFVMSSGKLLASNQGGELLFNTTVGAISVEPNSTAVIDVNQQAGNTTVRIYALEAEGNASIVVETIGTKAEKLTLAPGEALILANHSLAANEMQGTITSAKKLNATTARGSFSVKDFVEHDLIAKSIARPIGQ